MPSSSVDIVKRHWRKCRMPDDLAAADVDFDMTASTDWPPVRRPEWQVGQRALEFIDAGNRIVVHSEIRARHRPSGVVLGATSFEIYVVDADELAPNEYGGLVHGQYHRRDEALRAAEEDGC
jgi:hypothetical protein